MPAITATFRADVTQFRQALEQANTVVTGFGRTTTQVNRDLQRFGNEFSGAKLIREAETTARAVEQIGGAAKLTEAEHRRLNATLQEALSKYAALGQEAPDSLKKIAGETKRAVEAADELKKRNKETGESLLSLQGIAGKIGPALAGMFTVGAVVSFGKEILDLGGQINDLSSRTGIGVEAVQELKFAAEQSGTSIDVVAASVTKLSDGLAEGSKSTRAAVKDLGLSFTDLRNSSPEDAFTAVTEALKEIPDEMQRVNLGRELLGKGFDQLVPAIRDGFSELRQQARDTGQVLSEENVQALADFGDQWDATMNRIKGSTAAAVLDIGRGFSSMFAELKSGLDDLVPDGLVSLLNNPTVRMLLEQGGRTLAAQPIFGGGIVNVLRDAQARGAQEQGQARLERLRDEILRDRANSSGDPQRSGRQVESISAEAKAIQALADTLTGADIAGKLKQLDAAWKSLTPEQQKNEESIKRLVTAYADLRQRAGLKDLPRELERVHGANLPIVRSTDEMTVAINRLTTTALPDLSRRTTETRALLLGLRADGLLPVTQSFADLSGTMMTPWPVDPIKNVGDQIRVVYEGTNDWTGALDDAGRAFSQLGQISPLEGPLADFAELINLMSIGAQMAGGLANAFRAPRRDRNGNVVTDAATGAIQYSNFSLDNFTGKNGAEAQVGAYMAAAQIGLAASQGDTAVLRATNTMGRGNRALRGAAAGAAEGGAAGGPWGALGGAVIGAIIGAARNPAFEDVYHRVAKNFGTEISEEAARGIADIAKGKFGGDRAAAEIFSLDSIIGEGGGLRDSNIGPLTDRLRDVFVMLETGKFTAEQATDALDRSFGAFAEHIRKSESIASKAFQEVIALNERMGTDSVQIREFVEGQTAALGGGVARLAGPLAEQSAKLKGEIDKVKAERLAGLENGRLDDTASPDTREGREFREIDDRLVSLLEKQKELAAGSAAEFERLGVIAVGAFNASVAAGTDLITAVDALGPGLDTLLQIQKDLGIETTNAGLAELAQFRERVLANEALVAGTQALGETLRALTSIGGLTNETLAAMEAQGVQTFDRLIAAGFTENQALTQMKDFLLNVLEGHEQLGTPIDENTQKLIDQAREAGILKTKTKDGTKVMEEGFDKVVAVVGLLAKGLGQDVPKAIQDAIDKLEDIPRDIDVNVNVDYNDPGHTPNLGGSDGGGLPGAAGGIYATGARGVATWFGEGGRPELGGPVDFMGDVLARAARQNDVDLGGLAQSRYGGAPVIVQHTTLLDGAVIARNQSRHLPAYMRQMGVS